MTAPARRGFSLRLFLPDGVLVLEPGAGAIAALTWFGDPDLAERLGLG